jgi:hypothetical protein
VEFCRHRCLIARTNRSERHHRINVTTPAGKVIVCDSGALCTPDLSKLTYVNVRRPMFPLDRD